MAGPTWRYERAAARTGRRAVAGLDEVGRGSLAGPVVAAAVILAPERPIEGLDDSKLIPPARREKLAREILEDAVSVGLGLATPEEIEVVNVLGATRLAMERAVASLAVRADHLLLDAIALPGVDVPQESIIKGDRLSVSIAAASIVAKVVRDRVMGHYASAYPDFGFGANKGYGTPAHLAALAQVGPSPIHRRGYKGVWGQGTLAFGR